MTQEMPDHIYAGYDDEGAPIPQTWSNFSYIGVQTEYVRKDLIPAWRPISEAPRDGRMFLVMFPRMGNLVARARFNTVHKHFLDEHESDGGVTRPAFYHDGDLWCDIPQPPDWEG